MAYTTDTDLLALRQDILSLGVGDWSAQHAEAAALVDRSLDVGWYRAAATERGIDWRGTPFDGTRLLSAATQVKRLAAYRALELAYRLLARGSETDVFGNLADRFAKAAEAELQAVLAAGLDYDWDASGTLVTEERSEGPQPRRLVRQ